MNDFRTGDEMDVETMSRDAVPADIFGDDVPLAALGLSPARYHGKKHGQADIPDRYVDVSGPCGFLSGYLAPGAYEAVCKALAVPTEKSERCPYRRNGESEARCTLHEWHEGEHRVD